MRKTALLNIDLMLTQLRGSNRARTLFLLILGTVTAWTLAGYVVNQQILELGYIAIGGTLCVLIVVILNNWRQGVLIFLTWLAFEDLIRKYLGNNLAVYFGKDALAAVVYLSFFVAMRRQQITLFNPQFRIPLLIVIWFGALQIFNPGSPSIVFGLMGFKLFFYYVPLVLLGYSLLDSVARLRRFFWLNLTLILIIGSLGIAQSILGHTFLNPQTMQEDIRGLATLYRVSESTGLMAYRPTSVFVSTGRFCNFMLLGWVLVLGFTGYSLFSTRKARLYAFVVAVVTAGALILSTSRGAFVWGLINSVVFVIVFLWGAPWRTKEVTRVLRAIQQIAIGLILTVVLLFNFFPDALKARLLIYSETLDPRRDTSDLIYRTRDYPLANLMSAFNNERWVYGHGIGTCGLGTQYVARLFQAKPVPGGGESGFGSIMIEQGVIGLLLWLVLSGAILLSAWKVVRRLKGSTYFPLGFSIFWFTFMIFGPSTYAGLFSYEDFVLNAYLWLLLGMLFRLPSFVQCDTARVKEFVGRKASGSLSAN